MEDTDTLVALTAEIVAAHVSNNSVSIADIATLIGSVHASLSGLGEAPEAEPQPAEAGGINPRLDQARLSGLP